MPDRDNEKLGPLPKTRVFIHFGFASGVQFNAIVSEIKAQIQGWPNDQTKDGQSRSEQHSMWEKLWPVLPIEEDSITKREIYPTKLMYKVLYELKLKNFYKKDYFDIVFGLLAT